MRIYVTKDDIKKGKTGIGWACPIARSLKRRGFKWVDVDCFGITASSLARQAIHSVTPKVAKVFINRFDNKLPVEPFSFDLELEKP